MSERDRFDLTRGGEVAEGSAAVPSLRGRRRPGPRTPQQQHHPHREFAARVRVPPVEHAPGAGTPQLPVTTSEPAAVDWNDHDTAIRHTGPARRTIPIGLGVGLIATLAIALLAYTMIAAGQPSQRHAYEPALTGSQQQKPNSVTSALTSFTSAATQTLLTERRQQQALAGGPGRQPTTPPHPAKRRPTRSAAPSTNSTSTSGASTAATPVAYRPSSSSESAAQRSSASSVSASSPTAGTAHHSAARTPVIQGLTGPEGPPLVVDAHP